MIERIDLRRQGLSWLEEIRCGTWWISEDDLTRRDDFRERADTLEAAGINAIITFGCHFRWAFPEKMDTIYSTVEDIVSVCHEKGIRVIEHHSASFLKTIDMKRLAYQGEPLRSWCQIDARHEGPLCDSLADDQLSALCPNNPSFQAAYHEMVAGLMAAGIDGLMSDDIQWSAPYTCVCEYCREKFKLENGYSIPEIEDRSFWDNIEDERYRAYLQFRIKSTGDHHVRLMEMNNKLSRKLALLACCSNTASAWNAQTDAGVCDQFMRGNNLAFRETYISGYHYYNWPIYGAEAKHWSAIAKAYGVPALCMFYPRSSEERFFCWALTMTFGQRYWGCSRRFYPVRGWRDEAHYFEESLLWEREHQHLFSRPVSLANTAVLFSTRTRDLYGGPEDEYYTNEWLGWCETLYGAVIPYDVLPDIYLNADSLKQYQLLVLPNCACLSDEEASIIERYVREGGSIIATYETSLFDDGGRKRGEFALAGTLGVEYEDTLGEIDLPFRCESNEAARAVFSGIEERGKLHSPNTLVKISEETVTLARQIHSNIFKGYPFAVLNRYGRGRSLYISAKPGLSACLRKVFRVSAPFSEDGFSWGHGPVSRPSRWEDRRDNNAINIILGAVNYMTGKRAPLRVEGAPRGLIVSAFQIGDGDETAIHLLNAQGALLRDGALVGPQCSITYPALEKPVLVKIDRAAEDSVQAVLYSPDMASPLPLLTRYDEGCLVIEIEPEMIRRYSVILLK